MFAASYECTYSTFVRLVFQNTFEAVLCTPLMPEDIVAGEVAWGATKSVISGVCIFIVVLLMGLVRPESIVVILPITILVGLMFASLSMFFTSIMPNMDAFNYYFTLLVSPMFLFSGVFFPIDGMPGIVKTIAWSAAHACRECHTPCCPGHLLRELFTGDHLDGRVHVDILYHIGRANEETAHALG